MKNIAWYSKTYYLNVHLRMYDILFQFCLLFYLNGGVPLVLPNPTTVCFQWGLLKNDPYTYTVNEVRVGYSKTEPELS